MENHFERTTAQAAAFQKSLLDTMSKTLQTAFSCTPNSAPPELLQQIRDGIFRTLSESWEQFMRSPEFLDAMRRWMEEAVAFRKLTSDFLGRMRNEMQAPARADIDSIMLAVRHMEKRLLDRMDQLSDRMDALSEQNPRTRGGKSTAQRPKRSPARRPASRRGRSKKA